MITLGSEVKDAITGFKGIVTSRTVYINGCIQYGVNPGIAKDGKMRDIEYIDEQRLIVTKPAKEKNEPLRGGPQDHPAKNYQR